VLLTSTAWCIPHLGLSYADRNNSRTGAITHNSNRGNSSNNSNSSSNNNNSSTVLLPHHCSRLPSGRHSIFPPVTSPATIVERWNTLLESAANQSKATYCELWHLWLVSRGAIRRTLRHGLATPTIPPWRRFPREKKC
jgi:hypothetical protein